jgi:hypothetical protein
MFSCATSSKSWSSVASQKYALTAMPCFSRSRFKRTSDASFARVYRGTAGEADLLAGDDGEGVGWIVGEMPHCRLEASRRAPGPIDLRPVGCGSSRGRNRSSPSAIQHERFIPG